MIKHRLLLFSIALLLFARISAQQSGAGTGSTNITFVVKDDNTGFGVPGAVIHITAPDGKTSTVTAAANGKVTVTAVNGKYTYSIAANGYNPIETFFTTGSETNIEANILLEPSAASTTAAPQLRAATNETVVSGYVRDGEANTPLAGAQVTVGTASTVTDSKGFFSIQLPVTAPVIAPGTVPSTVAIRFTKNGYAPYTVQNFYVIPDSYSMRIALSPVSSARIQAKARAQQPVEESETEVHGLFDRKETDDEQRYGNTTVPQARVDATAAATVPTSIRIGTSCSCTSCSVVNVMTLEKYVQSGLDDEWISGWGAASLQAGAVAYRTYGAYYVLHPVSKSYDIASTTCNQAWQDDVANSCKNAAIATAGTVLVKSGAIFRAEYSAENNNAGCGDGYSGTGTSNGWPCISDARCKGYATNGHGRGMCQWGSSRWASDKTYTWILNHYYNPGGVTIQLPASPAVTTISFAVKDGSTGLAVASTGITITKPDGTTSTATTDANGKLVFATDSGHYSFAFAKSGYNSLSTFFIGGPNDSVYANINLDPVSTARVAATSTTALQATGSNMLITGYVRDGDLNMALAGVAVNAGNYSAVTNAQGYFAISVPASAIEPGKTPSVITIQSTKNGYVTNTIKNFYAIADTYEVQIALSAAGAAPLETTAIRRHGLFDKTAEEQLAFAGNVANPTARTSGVVTTAAALAVPTTIRVTTSCACSTCTNPTVEVMSLESYVQTGVDDEWISSWNAASLQAGTVAYRSRGAWFVQNPVGANYDISSAACHQTWQSDRATSVKNAAIATAGIVLLKNGAIYKAEYCAETNNAGCGDGYSGTSTDYPCIADARCAGRTKSGAGRGMCQWGSSFWGTDQTYTWILNHYYNPDGAAVQTSATASNGNTDTKTDAAGTMKVSPNPVSGSSIVVEYTLGDVSQPASIVVTDNYGNVAQQRSVVLQKGYNQLSIPTSGLKAGIYNVTLRLNATAKAKTQKIIVVK